MLTACSRAAGMSLFLCAELGRSTQQGERSCDGGAAFSPCLAPVLAHPVPFTGNEGDWELQNSGSEAGRCCRAGEEEECWVEHSRVRHQRIPKHVTDTIILPAAIRGSSRKALLVFFGFSPAHQSELGIASTDLLGQAEMWSGQGDELALSSLCAGGS